MNNPKENIARIVAFHIGAMQNHSHQNKQLFAARDKESKRLLTSATTLSDEEINKTITKISKHKYDIKDANKLLKSKSEALEIISQQDIAPDTLEYKQMQQFKAMCDVLAAQIELYTVCQQSPNPTRNDEFIKKLEQLKEARKLEQEALKLKIIQKKNTAKISLSPHNINEIINFWRNHPYDTKKAARLLEEAKIHLPLLIKNFSRNHSDSTIYYYIVDIDLQIQIFTNNIAIANLVTQPDSKEHNEQIHQLCIQFCELDVRQKALKTTSPEDLFQKDRNIISDTISNIKNKFHMED